MFGHYPKSPILSVGAQRRLPTLDYANPDLVVHVTICAAPDTVPFGDCVLAEAVIGSLEWLRANRGVSIYAYCLMPDHLHLLMRLGGDGKEVGAVLGAFKSFTTRQSWRLGYKGELWQARFYDRVLRSNESAREVAEYIRQNAVRRELVSEADEYPWSWMPDSL